jgi:NRAMP (natural resistance-associated macrophage protein)-like metal ion transporter
MTKFWKQWRIRVLLFLAVLGPGIITANVDNDTGGIFTYSQAGAQYGLLLLWTMVPITLALIVVQEMSARMGVVTGKGLSDLIREEFGLRMTFVMMILLVVVNYGNVVSEFSGVAESMQLFHVSKYLSVPICAAVVWLLVVKGDYKSIEKVFLVASVLYLSYIAAGVVSHPDWHEALKATVTLPPRAVWKDKTYITLIIGLIGTTIAPWMQFYLQSSVVDKGIAIRDYKASWWPARERSMFTGCVISSRRQTLRGR